MILRPRLDRVITLFEREAEILEILLEGSACSSIQVDEKLKNSNLLDTMRIIHAMEAKGLLERVSLNGKKLFRVKTSVRRIRVVKRELHRN